MLDMVVREDPCESMTFDKDLKEERKNIWGNNIPASGKSMKGLRGNVLLSLEQPGGQCVGKGVRHVGLEGLALNAGGRPVRALSRGWCGLSSIATRLSGGQGQKLRDPQALTAALLTPSLPSLAATPPLLSTPPK